MNEATVRELISAALPPSLREKESERIAVERAQSDHREAAEADDRAAEAERPKFAKAWHDQARAVRAAIAATGIALAQLYETTEADRRAGFRQQAAREILGHSGDIASALPFFGIGPDVPSLLAELDRTIATARK